MLVVPAAFASPAQTSVPGCSAMVADHATSGRTDLIAGTNVFNGELLRTRGDGHLILQCETVKLALAPDSSMRVFQYDAKTSVELEGGIVDYSTGGQSEDLSIYGLDVKVIPDTKQPTVGEVDVASDCELSVQSTKGAISVVSDKETKTIQESKAYRVTPKMGVDYSEDWRPVPADYPDYPHDAKYHESHHHVACAAAPYQNAVKTPLMSASEFHEILAVGTATGVGVLLYKKWSESPSQP
jgi:hypothetical protein